MGNISSCIEDLSQNTYLKQFCGKNSIPLDDSFWNRFLSFHIRPPLTRNDQIELDTQLDSFCQQLVINNNYTGNIAALINVSLMRINELLTKRDTENILPAWQTYNALFATRCTLKYIIETIGEDELVKHTEFQHSESNSNNMLPMILSSFFEALVEITIDVPLCEFTYLVHLEAINCLLVLLSVQLFSQVQAEYSTIYRIVMSDNQCVNASLMVCTLLKNFVEQAQAPPGILGPPTGSSIVLSLAAGLWNVITMGMSSSNKSISITNSGSIEGSDSKRNIDTPLASQSLLLLLVLTNHCTTFQNPYRDALSSFINVADDAPTIEMKCKFKFNVDKLFRALCKIPSSDDATLLLYMLLHRNSNFRYHIMKRDDIQQLVIPILQILYHAPENTSHHIYMSLIILLILSEDESFNKRIHNVMLKGISWYTERSISEISLGGLLILVVIRTIQYNILKMRDRYLHTNCLAALANMSNQFRSLHPYVSQRIVSLFETLAKKHTKLENSLMAQALPKSASTITVNVNGDTRNTDLCQDLTVLEEVLRMILEIINSCLSHQLAHNPNLIYTLLYKRDIFQPFRANRAFQDIIFNIDLVINFFSHQLEQLDQSQLGVDQVLLVIEDGIKMWSSDRLKKFPELKFKYVEEEQPEEFFIPYVWNIICQKALIHWNTENIKIFSPNQNEQSTIIIC